MLADLTSLPLYVLALLVVAAFVAGWVDAVVGGGGLIQLPALLVGLPASTPSPHILGTNKLSSVAGTLTAALTYARRIPPDWSLIPLVIGSAGGSATGAAVARLIPKAYLTPIVLIALIVVGLYTWRRPQLGLVHRQRYAGAGHHVRIGGIGLIVGLWDGLLGPGTGSFFIILMVAVLGLGFLEASAKAKIANLTTNIAAISVFGAHGEILWALGLTMAAANLTGGFIGARTALRHGNAFVRRVFLIVVAALIVKLAFDTVNQFI